MSKGTGDKAEKRAAKRMGGALMPASGALDGAKGDFNLDQFKVDSKATEQKSRAVKLSELQKITHEAASEGRTPAMLLQFVTGEGHTVPNGSWMILPEWAFLELMEGDEDV